MRHEGVIKIRRKIWFKMQENGCKGNIDWEKPIYTAEEVKILLDISDNTFRRWIAEGLISYTLVPGSNKKYIQRQHILDFMNDEKYFYPDTRHIA
jgi:hypothetical protein